MRHVSVPLINVGTVDLTDSSAIRADQLVYLIRTTFSVPFMNAGTVDCTLSGGQSV